MILDGFSEGANFWKMNPQLKILFEDFYNSDKSKSKDTSSKIMWGIYLAVHPKSEFYNIPDKYNIISKNVIKDSKFSWAKHQRIIDVVIEQTMTQAEKSLINWNDTLKKRDEFIHSQEFTLDSYNPEGRIVKGTADQLDKMLANTNKLYQEYFKILKELKVEEDSKSKGNKILSASDTGEI